MHRFFLPAERCQDQQLILQGREAHHATRVLRLKAGDEAVVLDGAGRTFHCRVVEGSKSAVTLEVLTSQVVPPDPASVALVAAIPKGQLFEDIVEHATELGASTIIPMMTERSNVRLAEADALAKQEKWQTISREAMKQSGNVWAPVIQVPTSFRKLLSPPSPGELALVGSLRPGAVEVRHAFAGFKQRTGRIPQAVRLWIGPEGDFTDGEIDQLLALGVTPITLGSRILRCPTAALITLGLVLHELRCSVAAE